MSLRIQLAFLFLVAGLVLADAAHALPCVPVCLEAGTVELP